MLEKAAQHLTWKARLVGASVAAGCAVGLLLAVLFACHWFVPSPDRVRELQAQSEQLAQVVAKLTDKGGTSIVGECEDCNSKTRKCIRTDESAGPFTGKDGTVWRVIQGY